MGVLGKIQFVRQQNAVDAVFDIRQVIGARDNTGMSRGNLCLLNLVAYRAIRQ